MTDEQRTTACCHDLAMMFWEILNIPIVLFFHLLSGCLIKFESKWTITKILNQWLFNVRRNTILNIVLHFCFFLRKRSCDLRIWRHFLVYQWVFIDTSEWVVRASKTFKAFKISAFATLSSSEYVIFLFLLIDTVPLSFINVLWFVLFLTVCSIHDSCFFTCEAPLPSILNVL